MVYVNKAQELLMVYYTIELRSIKIRKPQKLYTLECGLSYEDMGTVRNGIRRCW